MQNKALTLSVSKGGGFFVCNFPRRPGRRAGTPAKHYAWS